MKQKLLGVTIVAATCVWLSSTMAQSVVGTPEENKLTPRTATFYVNVPPETTPPDNVNNNGSEALGVAIANSGNIIIGWEDDGENLTDWEAVWTMYNATGSPITPNTAITSVDPDYAGQTIETRFLSYFRADGSAISGRTGWGPKIKANLFGAGVGMGSSTWDLGFEVVAFAPWTDANEDDYASLQLLTDDGKPAGILTGTTAAYAQGAGAMRIGDWDYLSNGNIVIVSESRQDAELVSKYGGAAPGHHIIFRILDPAGNVVKAETLVSETPAAGEMWHGVGVTANGFGVRFALGGKGTIRLFDNNGTPTTGNLDIATVTGKAITGVGGRGENIGFHGNGKDAYVLATSGTDDTGAKQVWVTVFNTDGTVRYCKAVCDDHVLSQVGEADAAIDPTGRVFAVWSAAVEGDYFPALVMGRVLDPAGTPIGGTFFVSENEYETTYAWYTSVEPRVAMRGDEFAVVWVSNNHQDYAGMTSVIAARVFGVTYEPGTIEAEGLTRIVPDTVINPPEYDKLGNWEPYSSVLGNSLFLIECNTFATNSNSKQQYVVMLQPVDGSKPARLTYSFYTDAGEPYGDEINLSRQDGNPGRVAGDKRIGAVNYMTGGEASPHGYPDIFGSDNRWNLGLLHMDATARYGCVQTFEVNLDTLAPMPLSKIQDSANGRLTTGETMRIEETRFGGELACLDNGNFVSVVEDRTGLRTGASGTRVPVVTIFAPDGTIVKEAFTVGDIAVDGQIWSNVCAYRGGFAVRRQGGIMFFFDNDGNLKGQVNQSTSGRNFDTGRGDGTRIQGHINSPYVFLTGTTGGALVSLACFDSRDFSFVAVQDVSEAGFPGSADRVGLAVDALNRVIVAWTSQPSDYQAQQVAARVMKFDEATKSITPLTHSFLPFINTAKTGGIRSLQMNPAITTKQIMVAAKGEINMENKPELGTNSKNEVNFYTVFTHPAPAEDPTAHVGPVTPPTMAVERVGNDVVISWPADAPGFTLYSAPSLPTSTWTVVPSQNNQATVAIGATPKFFRLVR